MSLTGVVLQPLDRLAAADVAAALNAAYVDYAVPIYLTAQSFHWLVAREDIRLEHSLAALLAGQIVGLGLLAVRRPRAWIGGMGILPAYRHQGIGRQIMGGLIAGARSEAVTRVQLEVITHNQPAYALYSSLGFVERRRLSVLFTNDGPNRPPTQPADSTLRVSDEDPASLLRAMPAFLEADLPWQHDLVSMERIIDRLNGLAARSHQGELAGACLWSGDEAQAGVLSLAGRSPEVGTALLATLRRRLPGARLAYLNVPADDPMLPILLEAGFKETLTQFEMTLDLTQETC